tara:strand:+ start:3203 stop:4063 length:861 start_codon:yes stop_codon:yes gene_type:complete
MLTSKSYAKINLSLELLNKRKDGFHNISSIMQTISLSDLISVSLSDQMIIDSNTDSIPLGSNLVYIAAQKVKEKFNIKQNAHIKLTKNIPMSSGLGGGSSNAATVINLLKELWDIKCSHQDLLDLASSIGSDVPFFLSGGTAFVSGKGEIINQLPDVQTFNLILITFKDLIKDKTTTMYSNIQSEHFTSGAITSNVKDKIVTGKTLNNGDLFNVFDLIVPNYIPNLKNIIKILTDLNFEEFHLAGSGPGLFFIIHDLKKAEYVQKELKNIDYLDSFVIQSHNQSVR